MRSFVKNNGISLIVLAFGTMWGLIQFEYLPKMIPTHFDLNGKADNFSSKEFAVFMLPVVSFFVILLTSSVEKISPANYTAKQSRHSIKMINFGIVLSLMIMHVAMIQEAFEPNLWMTRAIPLSIGMLSLIIGNYFGKIEKNFLVGVRTPWTIASDDNWKHTHRFCGKIFVITGIITLISAITLPNAAIAIALILIAALSGVVYSYIYFRKYETTKSS